MEPLEYRRMFEMEERHWWFQSRLRITEGILKHTVLPAFAGARPRLLDIGCGTGMFLQRRLEDTAAVGLDFSRDALSFSHGRGLPRLMRGDAARLPLRNESFDIVTAFDLIEHVENDYGVVREVWRVLRPGGFFLASVPAHPSLWSAHDLSLHHFRRYTKFAFEHLFASMPWRTLRQTGSFGMILAPAALVRWSQHLIPKRNAQADTQPVAEWLNSMLIELHKAEAKWLVRRNLPTGLSLLTLRQKPHKTL